jgi:hypothetical protein
MVSLLITASICIGTVQFELGINQTHLKISHLSKNTGNCQGNDHTFFSYNCFVLVS